MDMKTVNVGKTALICVRVEGDLEGTADFREQSVNGKELYHVLVICSYQSLPFPSPLHGFCHQ